MVSEFRNEEAIFDAALGFDSEQERAAYLQKACGDDFVLLHRVEALLKVHGSRHSFLEQAADSLQLTLNLPTVIEGPGTTIDRYKLLERIGEGGMAVVYMAEQQLPIRRRVALKIIKLGMDTKQVIARFEAERQALALMDHPNIAQVFDGGATETGRPYFVMELVRGVCITEYCDKNRLSTRERLELFTQVCNAVQHAHQKGIIHRDIKPSNVMVTLHDGKPVPKVIDFGIAKATSQRLTEQTLFTRYAQMIGTPEYMSPEQAEMSGLDIDTRTDIYSLGVLLYELLTGTTPLGEEELRTAGYVEMQRIIREQEPVRPSTKLTTLGQTLTDVAMRRGSTPDLLRRAVRGDLDWIVMKSLEKDRARRYEAAEGLALDIQRHLEHRPVLAHAPGTAYRLRKFLRRNRLQAAAALAAVLVVSVIVTLSVRSRYQVRLAEAEGARQVNVLSEARGLVAKGDYAAARKTLRPILESKSVGVEARTLFAETLVDGEEPDETVNGTEAIMERHYRERVQSYGGKIEADPTDPNNYLRRAQQYHYLHEERNVHADMNRYATILGQGPFPTLQFGTPKNLVSVVESSSRYQFVLSVAGRENGIVVMSIAFGQKGRSNMRSFEIPVFLASIFGVCFISAVDTPVVLADFTFGTPTNMTSINPDATTEVIGGFSWDGLEMYICSLRSGGQGNWDTWVLRRASNDDSWGPAENLGPAVNGSSWDYVPNISLDGLTLYFTSNRVSGYGDVYVTTRATKSSPWRTAVNLGPNVNSSADDRSPCLSPDGLELYITSDRPGGYGYHDIYVSRRATVNDTWPKPVNLGPVVNSPYGENYPCLSPDGRALFFGDRTGSFRPGGYGNSDLWMARRASLSDPWQTPVNLGPMVNGPRYDVQPIISPDGKMLYFVSDRSGSYKTWQAAIMPVVDFNGDGKVDLKDLTILSDNWGRNEPLCDIGPFAWGDGVVDERDLAILGEYMDVTGPVVAHSPGSHASEVPRDVILTWTPGSLAQAHDVYFGTSFEAVNNAERAKPLGVLVSPGQNANTYDPPAPLELGRTYYWRIDEVGAAPGFKTYRGFVWSFTTESLSYPIANVAATASSALPDAAAENTVNGSGLDANDLHSKEDTDMWLSDPGGPKPAWIRFEFDKIYKLDQMLVWNYNVMFEPVLGYGLRKVSVEHSKDGSAWTALGDFEFAPGTGKAGYACNTTVNFAGVAARYVRLTIRSNWRELTPAQYGLSEVRFLYVPAQATEPQPANGATGVSPNAGLSWCAGRGAAVHEVYLSTDQQAVASGTALVDRVTQSSYEPGTLNFGQTYYWKINEVNEAETPSVWGGELWSFSTQEYISVDDFESYTDDSPNRVFQTWTDGMGFSADASFPKGNPGNGTGSMVGYDPTTGSIMETSTVHGGRQAMPVEYNNVNSPFCSEIERTFDSPQDWTINGADTLALYFCGAHPAAFLERPDGSILMSGGGTDIWDNSDEFRFAYKPLRGDGSIVARVLSVTNTDVWAKTGVMIRETLDPDSSYAFMFLTPDGRRAFQTRTITGSATGIANSGTGAVALPLWVKVDRRGNNFTGYYSQDGKIWTKQPDTEYSGTSPSGNPQAITMTTDVYIGLAVTSHNVSLLNVAQFSDVSTTGAVTGQWQVKAIGTEQPSNDPAPLYVALEDDPGHIGAVTHADADADAVLTTSWEKWVIPLSEFTGVNLGGVKKMYIGVGDRNKPTAGGGGQIYIDDISFGHPLSTEQP